MAYVAHCDDVLRRRAVQICIYVNDLNHSVLLVQVFSRLKPGLDLSVNDLPVHARYQLAEVLDPRDHHDGRDWTTLASSLGLTDLLPRGEEDDSDAVPLSRLDAVLEAWSTQTGATIRDLHRHLVKLGRLDAVESLLSLAPLFKYV